MRRSHRLTSFVWSCACTFTELSIFCANIRDPRYRNATLALRYPVFFNVPVPIDSLHIERLSPSSIRLFPSLYPRNFPLVSNSFVCWSWMDRIVECIQVKHISDSAPPKRSPFNISDEWVNDILYVSPTALPSAVRARMVHLRKYRSPYVIVRAWLVTLGHPQLQLRACSQDFMLLSNLSDPC